jgi:4'-phosphopantetheinyl transferase
LSDDINIYTIDLQADEDQLAKDYALLSTAEKNRADAFKFPEHRSRYIIAHACLRNILSKQLPISPEKLIFTENAHKKPLIDGLYFNLSHSRDKMLLAVSESTPLGIDVEYVDAGIVTDGLAKTSFSPDEYKNFLNVADDKKVRAFFHLWTCKEAVIKAIGEGIYFGLDNFTIDVNEPRLLSIKNDDASVWQLQHIKAPNGFEAAIAWRGANKKLIYQ